MIDPTRDAAGFFAERLRHNYGLSTPATTAELEWVCRCEGVVIQVVPKGALNGDGHCIYHPKPVIILERGYTRFVLAHELYHHLVADRNAADAWPGYAGTREMRKALEERDAVRFAEILCTAPIALPPPDAAVCYAWAIYRPLPSTTHQIRFCRQWAREAGLKMVRNYSDCNQVWTPMPERSAGSRLMCNLADLRLQGVGTLVVAHRTRLAPADFLREPIIRAVADAGLELRSLELPEWDRPGR